VTGAVSITSLLKGISGELEQLGHVTRVIGAEEASPAAQAAAAGADVIRSVSNGAGSFGAVRKELSRHVSESEFALVATPALSEVADTELLASTCDVVILTLEAAKTTKAELAAATRALERIQPKAVSIMVTGYEPDPPIPPSLVAQIRSMRHRTSKIGEAL
jgi:hypothetical protein